MRITINPDAEISGFGYVEAGPYRLRVIKVDQQQGKKAPYLKWEFELTDPNIKATDGKSMPGHIFDNTTLKPEAQFALRAVVEGLGLAWEDFDTEAAIGLELDVQLKIKEYEGTFSNEISRVIPIKS